MKKKNFLRNLSTTALAICCLSSAVALPSYACLSEVERLENGDFECGYTFLFNSPVYSDTSAEPVDPVSNYQKIVINTAEFEPVNTVNSNEQFDADTLNNPVSLKAIKENDNGVVVVPEQVGLSYTSGDGYSIKITRVNSDVDFPPGTNTVIIHNNVDYDKDNIINKYPEISILRYKPGEGLFTEFNGIKCDDCDKPAQRSLNVEYPVTNSNNSEVDSDRTYYYDDCDRELNFGLIDFDYS